LLRDKDELKQSIEEFYQELREQKRKHWLDKQELEKERRRIEREFQQSDFDDLFDIL
jgi:trichohyalin